jgi:ABC-2 type transport system ATP-binding protein
MSKGMQRQAAIVMALSAEPKYIFFDEVFDGLDPVIRELVKKILIDFVEQSKATVIIASHNLRELEDVCDHIVLIHKGGALFDDDIDNLRLGMTRVHLALENPDDFNSIKDKIEIIKISKNGKMIEFTARGESSAVIKIVNSLNPIFAEALPLTLEELFISEMEAVGYDLKNLIG